MPTPAPAAAPLAAQRARGDEGPGIPEWYHAQVFSRFTQAGSGPARPHGGTGLGLNLTWLLTARLGGQIGFEPRRDRGTRFWVELPDLQAGRGGMGN